MKKFKYNDHKTNDYIIVYATDILAADIIYEKITKINPVKASYIGCETLK
jgi:hypothetical protein